MRARKLARRVGQVIVVAAAGVVLTIGGSGVATADSHEPGDTPDTPTWEAEPPEEAEPPVPDSVLTRTPTWE
jgi:hypothetical protein